MIMIQQKFTFTNEWLEKYLELVTNEPVEIGEHHHINPKCLFGPNDYTIKISFLDHFKCHWYLYKAFKEEQRLGVMKITNQEFRKICFGLSSFNQIKSERKKKLGLLSEEELDEYGKLIAETREANSVAMRGDNNPAKQQEVRELISLKKKGISYGPRTQEAIAKSKDSFIKNGNDISDMVFMYHKVSGEVCRVYKCIADMLPDSWAKGVKHLPNDELFWPYDYIRLKWSLGQSESSRGKIRSVEHINKINKNPEKIRKTAEWHTGKKRPKETGDKIRQKRKEFIERNGGPSNLGMQLFYDPNDPVNNHIQCYEKDKPDNWVKGSWKAATKVIGEVVKVRNSGQFGRGKKTVNYHLLQRVVEDYCYLINPITGSKIRDVPFSDFVTYTTNLKEAGFEITKIY